MTYARAIKINTFTDQQMNRKSEHTKNKLPFTFPMIDSCNNNLIVANDLNDLTLEWFDASQSVEFTDPCMVVRQPHTVEPLHHDHFGDVAAEGYGEVRLYYDTFFRTVQHFYL